MEGQYVNEAVYTAQNGGFNMEEQMSRQATDENAIVTAGMNVNGDIYYEIGRASCRERV